MQDKLIVKGIDMLNGTLVVDIKPYVPQFDSINAERIGWLEGNVFKHKHIKDDGRFF